MEIKKIMIKALKGTKKMMIDPLEKKLITATLNTVLFIFILSMTGIMMEEIKVKVFSSFEIFVLAAIMIYYIRLIMFKMSFPGGMGLNLVFGILFYMTKDSTYIRYIGANTAFWIVMAITTSMFRFKTGGKDEMGNI